MTGQTTTPPEIAALVKGLTKAQREAVTSAALMVSGGYRVHYKFAGPCMRSLVDLRLLDAGKHYPGAPYDHSSYLNDLGLSVQSALRAGEEVGDA